MQKLVKKRNLRVPTWITAEIEQILNIIRPLHLKVEFRFGFIPLIECCSETLSNYHTDVMEVFVRTLQVGWNS